MTERSPFIGAEPGPGGIDDFVETLSVFP
ncbi:predicted protein [Streptomyces iranensis]|uniref:Uncharacterized protein n=1 Tax=Streptomyces iranensis TaxID=576784 RepID=A0A061ABV8_9ACTN|nr:predicted protein [Streptomyces iranensis]